MGKKQIIEKTKEELAEEARTIEEKQAKQASKGSKSKKIDKGRVYIKASYNNTFICITDDSGNVVAWMSAGSLGFSGPKKATPFAASKVTEAIAEKVSRTGPHEVRVYVKGIGPGRDSVLRTLSAKGFEIQSIEDITPIPHNGPRPRKARRV